MPYTSGEMSHQHSSSKRRDTSICTSRQLVTIVFRLFHRPSHEISVNAAERFYQRSHEVHRQVSEHIGSLTASRALSRAGHRYYCVYEHLSRTPNACVVDLGFGTTHLLSDLASLCRSYTIVDVIDRTDGVALPSNTYFKQADLNQDFPFESQTFDCTVAMMIVEHLFDPFHAFHEITRITKRGGKIFINLPNIAAIKCRLQLAVGKLPITSSHDWFNKREWDGNHLHYFTVKEVIRLAQLQGLTFDALFPVGKWPWLKQISPGLLCHEISYGFSRH